MSAGVILLLALDGYAKVQVNRKIAPGAKVFLQKGWAIQSSALIKEKGDALSQNTFRPTVKWYPAAVPSTVVGTLVENKAAVTRDSTRSNGSSNWRLLGGSGAHTTDR